jgi:hypothetical protein
MPPSLSKTRALGPRTTEDTPYILHDTGKPMAQEKLAKLKDIDIVLGHVKHLTGARPRRSVNPHPKQKSEDDKPAPDRRSSRTGK